MCAMQGGSRSSGREEGAQPGSRALPLRSLLDRLGSGSQLLSWSCYLPSSLQPPLPPPVAAVVSQRPSLASGSGRGGETGEAAGFGLEGLLVAGRVWSLSQEPIGCRQVQAALDAASSDKAREALAGELRGHVVHASRCPHANHVLQKVVAVLRPGALQFVVEELLAGTVGQTARHKYGCRVVQRLVERCHPHQVQRLVDRLVPETAALGRHPYGNYVVQNLFGHGSEAQRRRMTEGLMKELRLLGSESCGCAVLGAALRHAGAEDRQQLARQLLEEPGLLAFMACSRYGHAAVLRALDVLEGPELEVACDRLEAEARSLRASRYGRVVVQRLQAREAELLNSAFVGGA